VTLLRISNYLGKLSFSVGLEWLGTLDGVSPRSAFRVNAKLEERGLVHIERDRNPTRYTLNLLSEWKRPMAGIQLTGNAENVTTKGRRLEVPKWGQSFDCQISWK
jgi:DNA-binding transcriptional ArsR family regulator